MKNILNTLGQCIEESTGELKGQPDYLTLRSGKFNYKPGFVVTSDPLYSKPSLILDDSLAPDYNLSSSSIFTEFDFSRAM